MAATDETTHPETAERPGRAVRLELPTREAPLGPVTARLQRRWTVGYLGLWAASMLTIARGKSPAKRTLAVGAMLPGGGYAYQGKRGRAAGSAFGTLFGFIMWVLLGMMFLPFTIWALAAWLAARVYKHGPPRRRPGPREPAEGAALLRLVALGPALLGAISVSRRIGFQRAKRSAQRRNEQLSRHLYVTPTGRGNAFASGELSVEQLQFQRYLLDRALQPVDRFDGFDWVDQFREAAVRYQLNYAQWGLALGQYRCTPAFQGYVTEAQRRLIQKMTARKVWQYWRWENLWGNFSRDPDPIRKDNIMFSGYLGLMIAAYEAVTGDRSFDASGSLEFRWSPRKSFIYDDASIARAVFENMSRAGYAMFPCEPNWVYETCNRIGFAGLVGHDCNHGTDYAARLRPRFRKSVEQEFCTADGRPITIRASRAGIAIPGIAASTANETAGVFFLSPSLHDVATRQWLLARDGVMGRNGRSANPEGSGPIFKSPFLDKMDIGQYKPSWGALTFAFALAAAQEMGDGEAERSLRTALERVGPRKLEDGVASYPGSVMANMMMAPGEFGGERAFHDLLVYGIPEERRGWPRLAQAPYPDALVARAVSDGHAIDLVLHPGGQSSTVTLGFDNLVPDGEYELRGSGSDGFTADRDGRGSVIVELSSRTPVTVIPVT